MKTKYWLIAVLFVGIISFLMGRLTSPVKEVIKIEYIKLPPETGEIKDPDPIEEKPSQPIPPQFTRVITVNKIIRDTVYVVKEVKADSSAIVEDWRTERKYSQQWGTDTTAIFTLNQTVLYNTIKHQDYNLQVYQKTVTIERYKERSFQFGFFIGSDFKFEYPEITGLVKIKSTMLGLGYDKIDYNKNVVKFKFGYMF